jgi:hypothetical protein
MASQWSRVRAELLVFLTIQEMLMTAVPDPARSSWRTPIVVLVCGCLISLLTFGPRASLGLFTVPYTVDRGFSLEMFSFAMAV